MLRSRILRKKISVKDIHTVGPNILGDSEVRKIIRIMIYKCNNYLKNLLVGLLKNFPIFFLYIYLLLLKLNLKDYINMNLFFKSIQFLLTLYIYMCNNVLCIYIFYIFILHVFIFILYMYVHILIL